MAEPDAPSQKRPRLDSGDQPLYNGHAFAYPPPPPHSRPPSHPSLAQAPSPPPSRHYPPHSLPPPPQPYPPQTQASFPGPLPSPSLPPSDIRAFADPRNIPSPGHPPHGVAGPPPVTIPKDRITAYRPPSAPQSASALDHQRSRSTSLSIDSKPPPPHQVMEHGGHQSPWSMPEHRLNGSMSNGYGHTISPPHPSGSAFHPPQPQPPSQQYAPPVNHYAQSPYMGDYAGTAQQARRKQVRATQACNHCRSRKQKCDEARPCQFCRENNFECQYKDVPPPKQDRSMMQLQDSMNSMSDILKELVRGVGEFNEWKQSVESRLGTGRSVDMISNQPSPEATFAAPSRDQNPSRWPTPTQPRAQVGRINTMKMGSPIGSQPNMSPNGAQASTPIKQELVLVAPQQPATPADSVKTDYSRATDNSPREKAGLQGDHTTPAHKLLEEWRAMSTFYKDVGYLNKIVTNGHYASDYPMLLEQERGLLRVWGVGEGQDLNDSAQGPGSPESANDYSSNVPSPASGKEGLWGYASTDQPTPSATNGETPQEFFGTEGGLGSDGCLNVQSHVTLALLDSYLDSMHNLHPFMNRTKLNRMFKDFNAQNSPDAKAEHVRSPAYGGLPHQLNQGLKRKRFTSGYGEPPRGAIERSLRNAIVLLVCALGKVFSYTSPRLPAPSKDKGTYGSGAWGHTGGSPHPISSFTGDSSDDNCSRNIDILPGMAYFAYATDILGNHQGGNTIAHAQAMILAALYLSQFARVLESWSWINCACRITLVLIKADYPKLLRSFYLSTKPELAAIERYRLNLVMCIYWTCLQLESDIVAEMSTLPPSGISAHQNLIMYPTGVSETFPTIQGAGYADTDGHSDIDETSMMIYSSQIWLRVLLNEAHNSLYGVKGSANLDNILSKEGGMSHAELISGWRAMLPSALVWKDNDPPPTDLNQARLRAKYYGGLYIMLRPYLRMASHNIGVVNYQDQNNANVYGETSNTNAYRQVLELTDEQKTTIANAHRCIECAIRSTVAFDRVGADPNSPYENFQSTRTKRLVVTNIFGTLHAQFGNMLVLTSVYRSKLRPLLPVNTRLTKENLTALLKRTINILEEVAPNSPILNMDLEILRCVGAQSPFTP